MSEFVGYRVNAVEPAASGKKGFVTVYAERKNSEASLGEYGGDAYPVVSAVTEGDTEYGIVLAADGVGQGAYTHPSLQAYLEECNGDVKEEDRDFAKLSCFLRTLYGAEIFDGKNADVLSYAMRCFSDVPMDGYYVAPDEREWKDPNNTQAVMPFYKRDSQSLGSRILCVYIYLKYRNYMYEHKITSWTEEKARELRDLINGDVQAELRPRVLKMFKHSDTTNKTKQMRYFLCSTVAVWFYTFDKKSKHISALSLNCGDARTYVVNGTDGVRQISLDDAFEDGMMKGFFHFGSDPDTSGDYCDNTLFARIVEADAPCILFACSDGVYDTCPGYMQDDGKKISLPYGESTDAYDFLFNVNMLAALRRCHSYEDFKREVVFNFYAQDTTQSTLEAKEGGLYPHVKRDDSGTLAARFFEKTEGGELEILEVLRQNEHTAIDELYALLKEYEHEGGFRIPYYHPHVQSASDTKREEVSEYATGIFKNAMANTVKAKYPELFANMKKNNAQTLWGVQHNLAAPLAGFPLTQFLKVPAYYATFFNLAMEDWGYLTEHNLIKNDANGLTLTEIPKDWEAYAHVICDQDVFQILTGIDFETKYREFTSGAQGDKTGDVWLQLYEWFEERYSGTVKKSRNAVWTAADDGRKTVKDEPTPDSVIASILKPAEPEKTAESEKAAESEKTEKAAESAEPEQTTEPEKAEEVDTTKAEATEEPKAEKQEEPQEEEAAIADDAQMGELSVEEEEGTDDGAILMIEEDTPKTDSSKTENSDKKKK